MKSTIHTISHGLFAAIALAFGACSQDNQDTPPATPAVEPPVPEAAPAEPAAPAAPVAPVAKDTTPATPAVERSAPEAAPAKPAAPAVPVAPAAPAGPVATVNGTEITQEQLLQRFRTVVSRQMGQQDAQIPPEQFAQILGTLPPEQKADIVNDLIDEQLLVQAAKTEKIEVPAEKIEEQIKTIPVPPNMELAQFLKMQGVTEEKVRADFARGMSINMLIEKKTEGKIEEPKPEAIEAFYNENPQFFEKPASVKARHILIKTDDPAAETAAKEKIDAIRLRVVGEKAEDFATVAKETSEGPSGPNGGDLGEFGPGQMVPEFDKAVFSMKKDEISEPIKTQFGYHIIKVDETQAAGKEPLDDALKTKITGALKGQGEQKVVEEYLEALRKDAKIERS